MKRLLLLGVLLSLSSFLIAQASPLKEEQHRASLTIMMVNDKETAGCTANAISEHVLLTAAHCNLENAHLYLNQISPPWVHPLEISEKFFDHQDHMLLVVPGVSFKHHVIYEPSDYHPLSTTDHYYFWGSPGLIMDQYREGYVTGAVIPPAAEGAIDVGSPVVLLSGPVVGGDSGSAVFAQDGRLAGIVTYAIHYGLFVGIYPLAFTPAQVEQAEGKGNYVYVSDPTPPVARVNVVLPKQETPRIPSVISWAAWIMIFYFAVSLGVFARLKSIVFYTIRVVCRLLVFLGTLCLSLYRGSVKVLKDI